MLAASLEQIEIIAGFWWITFFIVLQSLVVDRQYLLFQVHMIFRVVRLLDDLMPLINPSVWLFHIYVQRDVEGYISRGKEQIWDSHGNPKEREDHYRSWRSCCCVSVCECHEDYKTKVRSSYIESLFSRPRLIFFITLV